MFLFGILLTILAAIYVLRILQFYRGLFRLKKGENDRLYSVSVVIPARNEADNIEDCLNALV
ncbi:hypothetical protein GF337_17580, partial [candidate division KSB1 bacterium]|nr:hypothetical protein [candidate division KSB1 bacterium]